MEGIRLELEAIKYPELNNESVLVSTGLHKYQNGEGKETSFTLTDDALYLAKKTGKNKIVKSR
jgi:PleD family two-component response regulator